MDFFKFFLLGITSIFKGIISSFRYFFIGFINTIIFIPKYFVIGIMVIFGKRKKEKISKENKNITFTILCLSLIVYLVCVFMISRWSVQSLKIKYLSNDIINSTEILEEQEKEDNTNLDNDVHNNNDNNNNNNNDNDNNKPYLDNDNNDEKKPNNNSVYYPNDYKDYLSVPFMNVDFNDLLKKNKDTVGWIKVEGTKVNYPVVQADNNDYYLNRSFNKKKNASGWVFADYRVSFDNFGKNTIIYGHNMTNKTMFGSIPSMLNNKYLKNSNKHYVKISTPNSNSVWKVFSIYTIKPEVYYLKTNFKSEPYDKFLNKIKKRSVYNFKTEVSTDDKILTLSTCDNTGTKRIAVHAKMINIEYK